LPTQINLNVWPNTRLQALHKLAVKRHLLFMHTSFAARSPKTANNKLIAQKSTYFGWPRQIGWLKGHLTES